jgi:hypothetical protein
MRLLLLVIGKSVGVNLRLGKTLLCEELVNARGVFRTPHLRFVRHLVLFRRDLCPVDICEERMLLQVSSVLIVPNTFTWIPFQKLLQQTCCLLRKV